MTTHQRYWDTLPKIAATSHDPDTQTACIIRHRWNGRIVTASNRIADGLTVTQERITKPSKYDHIGHAEIMAICKAAIAEISTLHATMYLNWFPCNPCTIAIVQAGIGELHVDLAAYQARKDDPRYGFALAMEKLSEAGVKLRWH